MVQNNRKSSTIKSYISAIRAVLQEIKIELKEDRFLLTSLTKACQLRNDVIRIRLPIQKGMLAMILKQVIIHYSDQPYLRDLYRAMFSMAYFGLFRVGEITATAAGHQVMARDVHIGLNKDKIMFVLRSSKTHGRTHHPQMIKISSARLGRNHIKHKNTELTLPCSFQLLCQYLIRHGSFRLETEPFFIFADKLPVRAENFRTCLKVCIQKCGLDNRNYNTHGLRSGCSCDLYKLRVSVESIKKLGRWKSNSVFQYLRNV